MARGHGLMGCQSMCLPFECAGMIPPEAPAESSNPPDAS